MLIISRTMHHQEEGTHINKLSGNMVVQTRVFERIDR